MIQTQLFIKGMRVKILSGQYKHYSNTIEQIFFQKQMVIISGLPPRIKITKATKRQYLPVLIHISNIKKL